MAPYISPHHVGNQSAVFTKDNDGRMTIPLKDLNIVWGHDNRYWKVPNNDMPVELYQVSWLEVTGCVDRTDPDKNYEVEIQISLNQDAFGWGSSPIYIMVKRGKGGKFAWRKHHLDSFNVQGKFMINGTSTKGQHSSDKKLYFGIYEVWSGKWKGGLKIHQVFVRELQ